MASERIYYPYLQCGHDRAHEHHVYDECWTTNMTCLRAVNMIIDGVAKYADRPEAWMRVVYTPDVFEDFEEYIDALEELSGYRLRMRLTGFDPYPWDPVPDSYFKSERAKRYDTCKALAMGAGNRMARTRFYLFMQYLKSAEEKKCFIIRDLLLERLHTASPEIRAYVEQRWNAGAMAVHPL